MFSSRGTVRYEERGQGYRDVEKVGKHCCNQYFSGGRRDIMKTLMQYRWSVGQYYNQRSPVYRDIICLTTIICDLLSAHLLCKL